MKAPPLTLPEGSHVKVIRRNGAFIVATKFMGEIVGARLDKGKGNYPTCNTYCGTLAEARVSMIIWEKFCEDNKK
jgi:hypothetical protein